MKEAMKKPIAALPVKELCEYEKIREENIRERYEAMKQYRFFEELQRLIWLKRLHSINI